MRRLMLCAVLAACGDNGRPALGGDAGVDAAPVRLTGCLDTPALPAAPGGQLPCDLVPPGLTP